MFACINKRACNLRKGFEELIILTLAKVQVKSIQKAGSMRTCSPVSTSVPATFARVLNESGDGLNPHSQVGFSGERDLESAFKGPF